MLVVGAVDISAPFIGPTETHETLPVTAPLRVAAF